MKIAKTAAAAVSSIGLVVGLAGFAGATSGTIGYTGPSSNNQITSNLLNQANLWNNNNLNANTNNNQNAYTGDARVKFNTFGGNAMTGSANNYNSTNVVANVQNGSGWAGLGGWFAPSSSYATINTTGPLSNNQVFLNESNLLNVNNNNNVNVNTNNNQNAMSGNAEVSFNTQGGSAITGNATNTNSTAVSIGVNN